MSRRVSAILGVLGGACIIASLVLLVRQYRQPANGPAPQALPADIDALVPFDASITTRKLANGLTYFVKANKQPLGRAELRLVVNAGSLLEEDDQRGLAHFVEHMAFNGTTRFPKHDIGAFMESIGMRFGPGVNATTNFDETTYALQIPTDNPAVIDRALMVLEDWAHNVTFDPAEVDKERGVIIEEWRLRRGVGARVQDIQLPALFKGSRYVDRSPIGTPESIQTFKQERLRQFYTDWYRPDLMAVVAVGDLDAKAMADAIERHFIKVPAAASPKPRPEFPVPALSNTEFNTVIDAEVPSTNVAILNRRTPHEAKSVRDYRDDVIERLAIGMLSIRLTDISQLPKGPFISANALKNRVTRSLEQVSLGALASNSGVGPALSALAIERERAIRLGFTQPELDQQKTTQLRGFERAIAELEHQPSSALAAEYVRHFTVGEPVPGLQWEFDTNKALLPTIGLDDVNHAIIAALPEANRVVSIAAPKKTNVYVPPVAELQSVITAAKTAPLQPWVPRINTSPLLDTLPESGAITATIPHTGIGVTEWTLSNGARVVLKPTDFKDDQIVFTAVSAGGLSLAPEADLVSAQLAVQVVTSMGFGKFGSGDLRHVLTGKAVGVQPAIGPYEEGLSGGSSRADLESMFQLVYLTVTSPRRDPGIFAAFLGQVRMGLAGQAGTPEYAFSEALSQAISQNHPRARPIRPESLDQLSMDKALAFYRERFADASGFTFVFAGSFTLAEMRPLVERYIASLPATKTPEKWKDHGIRPPRGIVERVVKKGIEPKSRTVLLFTGSMDADRVQALTLASMAEVLETRLRDAIREDLGGTYSINVGAAPTRVPVGQYTLSIDFTADPKRVDALTTRVLEEIAAFKKTGPTAKEIADVKAGLQRDFESSSRQNAFLAGQLAQRIQTGEALESLWQLPELFKALTSAEIHDAARRYLDTSNYIRVTLKPEK